MKKRVPLTNKELAQQLKEELPKIQMLIQHMENSNKLSDVPKYRKIINGSRWTFQRVHEQLNAKLQQYGVVVKLNKDFEFPVKKSHKEIVDLYRLFFNVKEEKTARRDKYDWSISSETNNEYWITFLLPKGTPVVITATTNSSFPTYYLALPNPVTYALDKVGRIQATLDDLDFNTTKEERELLEPAIRELIIKRENDNLVAIQKIQEAITRE